jgi:hypothetical protein
MPEADFLKVHFSSQEKSLEKLYTLHETTRLSSLLTCLLSHDQLDMTSAKIPFFPEKINFNEIIHEVAET